jgi:hypothetical protein
VALLAILVVLVVPATLVVLDILEPQLQVEWVVA